MYRNTRNDSTLHTKSYTSHEYDDVTKLTYAHARYLDTASHSFLSVDPMIYKLPQSYLTDPQQMNSYSYARNNPVVNTDPDGKFVIVGVLLVVAISSYFIAKDFKSTVATFQNPNSTKTDKAIAGVVFGSNFVGGSAEGQAAKQGAKALPAIINIAGDLRNGAKILSESEKPASLFHYTSDQGLKGILTSGKINPSTISQNAKDARIGDGQYFSDVVPGTKTSNQLSKSFYNDPRLGNRLKNYVEISTKGIDIAASADRPGVYLIPNLEPLEILSRIINYGKN